MAAEIAGERVLDDAWEAWFDARMREADPVLLRALTLGLKVPDLRGAAVRMAFERDILGRPVSRPPFSVAALRDRLREALATLAPLKGCCTDTGDAAFQEVLRLEAFCTRVERAEGLALERLLRELDVTYSRGQQGHWSSKDACRDVKAELKSVSEAQAAYVRASNADLAWALRDRLLSFLEAYEALKRDRAVVDFADLLLKARDVLTRSIPVRRYFQKRFDFILVDEFQDTDPLQAEIAFLLSEDPEGAPAADWRTVKLAPGKLFVVGDPKQSIYRFRRADIAIYEEAKRLVEASGGEVLPLTANFRTVPSVHRLRERALLAALHRARGSRAPAPRSLPRRRSHGMGHAPSRCLFQRTACPTTAPCPKSSRFSPRPWPASSSTSPEPAPGAFAIAWTTPSAPHDRATSACWCER